MDDFKLLRMGHPLLRKKVPLIKDISAVKNLALNMKHLITLEPWSGVAAPQLGHALRMVAFQLTEAVGERKNEVSHPPRILINPVLTPLTDETKEDWEACLSLPDLMGLVRRPTKIRVQGCDETGAEINEVAEGHYARIIQHECDHLDGILYVDRMTDMTKLIYRSEYPLWLEAFQKAS